MPQKNTDLLADKSYVKPDPPKPVKALTAPEKTKVKARIKSILKDGPGSKDAATGKLIPAGPMETWKVVLYTCHHGRKLDGIPRLTAAQVKELLPEMKEAGDFAPGFGGQAIVAQPEPLPE